MKADQFKDAMALYAEADQRATANLIELVTATVLRKLALPEDGKAVSVTFSPDDLSDTAADFYFEADYADEAMTITLTRLVLTKEAE